jgi:pyruvate dehydrogenase E2 component (dihydrolipoamide acetyltransferase)
VWGEHDEIIPAAHAEAAPGRADVHVVDGAGHSPHMETAGRVNDLVARFVQGVPAAR